MQKFNVSKFNGKILFINNFTFTFMSTGVTNGVTNVTTKAETTKVTIMKLIYNMNEII